MVLEMGISVGVLRKWLSYVMKMAPFNEQKDFL